MKLFIALGSPYARMARIAVLEKGLEGVVEFVIAQTRTPNSPYYSINPSGRVPYLARDDGAGMEESALICGWLDCLKGERMFNIPAGAVGWEARRLEAMARSMLDGLSVWLREILLRPVSEQSMSVILHEAERARRIADLWEIEIVHPWMNRPLNLAQLTLACALGLEAQNPDFVWRPGHPNLCLWFDQIAARPSFMATAPPSSR
jgi:glutathione S-transferase